MVDVAPASVPAVTPITATRGGWLRLEALAGIGEAFPNKVKSEKAIKLILFLQRENPVEVDHPDLGRVDFNLGLPRDKGETDLDFSHRGRSYSNFYKSWSEQSLTLQVSEKRKKLIVDLLEWYFKNRTKVDPRLQINDVHLGSLITAFALTTDDSGNPADDD